MTTTFDSTNTGFINSQRLTFTNTTDRNIVFDGSLVGPGKSNLFLVSIADSAGGGRNGAYIYRYNNASAANCTSDWITPGTSAVLTLQTTTQQGTYITGFVSANTYTISVTILG
jgi:hypothetical protein